VVEKLDVIGVIPILRFNLLHLPFDNIKLKFIVDVSRTA